MAPEDEPDDVINTRTRNEEKSFDVALVAGGWWLGSRSVAGCWLLVAGWWLVEMNGK
jgi:hypothetical protein